jgi:hypothetical protein
MNKNRMMRPTAWGELANDSEARFHQALRSDKPVRNDFSDLQLSGHR